MDPFGDWIATKNGVLDTLLAMIKSGETTHHHTRTELLAAITEILDAGRAAGDLRDDIAPSLVGIFSVAPPPEDRADRLPNILMDGLSRLAETETGLKAHVQLRAPMRD